MSSTVGPEDSMPEDFDFGFGPILRWLLIIGVDLKTNQLQRCKIFRRICQFGWFLCATSVNFFTILYVAISDEGAVAWLKDTNYTRSLTVLNHMTIICNSLHCAGIHILLLRPFKANWNGIWNSLNAMRQLVAPDLNLKLRRISIIGLVYIITLV